MLNGTKKRTTPHFVRHPLARENVVPLVRENGTSTGVVRRSVFSCRSQLRRLLNTARDRTARAPEWCAVSSARTVSYKWLSRNFLVPSNTAKRLLQEFVEKNGSQLKVIYSLSGWLKNNPEAYHVKLVLGSKLSGVSASAKPKPEPASVKADNVVPISNDAQVRANELVEDESSDDDASEMNFKRGSNGEGNNRKRRVVLDYSDEDDDNGDYVVNLASPDPPKKQVSVDLKKSSRTSELENKNLVFDEPKEEKVKVKKEKASEKEYSHVRKVENPASNENKCPEKNDATKDKAGDAAQNALKKRKVLKTRIDERGREGGNMDRLSDGSMQLVFTGRNISVLFDPLPIYKLMGQNCHLWLEVF
ncbi:DNA polymerase subunit Cdc27 [Tanacetum coccineum]